MDGKYLSNLRFAEDIVLFSNDGDELQNMIDDLNRENIKIRLKMNRQKTKVMLNSLAKEPEFNNETIECINEYVYMGQLLTGAPTDEKEILRRIRMRLERIRKALRNHDWKLSALTKAKSFQSLHSPSTNVWCRNVEDIEKMPLPPQRDS